MGLEARHSYRCGYLKSDHWQNLRLQKLADMDAHCWYCDRRDLSNDVHHVYYPESLYDTTVDDLRVLCREHHTMLHELMDQEIEKADKKEPKSSNRKGVGFRMFRICSEKIEGRMRSSGIACYTRQGRRVRASSATVQVRDRRMDVVSKLLQLQKTIFSLGEKSKTLECPACVSEKIGNLSSVCGAVSAELNTIIMKEMAEVEKARLYKFIARSRSLF